MNDRPASRYLPALLVLFVGSGCAALIYEIVWFQLLQLVIGSSAVSLACCWGRSWAACVPGASLLPGWSRQAGTRCGCMPCSSYRPARAAVLFAMPAVVRVYSAVGGTACPASSARPGRCVCLLPPTFLMGATLPAISRWVEATPRGVSWLGFSTAATSRAR